MMMLSLLDLPGCGQEAMTEGRNGRLLRDTDSAISAFKYVCTQEDHLNLKCCEMEMAGPERSGNSREFTKTWP